MSNKKSKNKSDFHLFPLYLDGQMVVTPFPRFSQQAMPTFGAGFRRSPICTAGVFFKDVQVLWSGSSKKYRLSPGGRAPGLSDIWVLKTTSGWH